MNPESSNKPTPPPRRSRPVQEKQGEGQSKAGSIPKSDNDSEGQNTARKRDEDIKTALVQDQPAEGDSVQVSVKKGSILNSGASQRDQSWVLILDQDGRPICTDIHDYTGQQMYQSPPSHALTPFVYVPGFGPVRVISRSQPAYPTPHMAPAAAAALYPPPVYLYPPTSQLGYPPNVPYPTNQNAPPMSQAPPPPPQTDTEVNKQVYPQAVFSAPDVSEYLTPVQIGTAEASKTARDSKSVEHDLHISEVPHSPERDEVVSEPLTPGERAPMPLPVPKQRGSKSKAVHSGDKSQKSPSSQEIKGQLDRTPEWDDLKEPSDQGLHATETVKTEEIYLKRTISIEDAPIEFTVRVNKKYFPSYFVVMDFFKSESGNGKKIPAAWKDTLMSHRDIHDETSFKNMVKDVVTKAEEDRITGLVFYPLMNSGFGHSVGKQIEMFCDESKKINYRSPENPKKRYLREVWFAVDEAGFTNAENQLLSSTFMSSFTGRSSLWEKCQMKDAPNKMSVNVIGPTKEIVQSAITEMKIVLNQSDPQHRGKAEHRKPSEVKPSVAKEDYLSQGARPKQSGDIRVSGPIHQSTAENRVYLREDSSNEAKPANLDALEMTANVNQGIVDFLEGKGPNILSKWKMQVMKGFGVRFETDARKLTVLGTFPQLNVFQDYLYNDFPTFPEDKTSCKSLHDQSSHLDTEYMPELESAKFFSNCEDGIMFQYKIGSVRVIVYKGDITKIETDCIISSATSNLTAKLGIERAIFKAAGDEVSKECKEFILKNKQLDPGKAIVTEGGRLKCKKIIHYVVQGSMTDIRKRVGDAMEICIEEAQNQRFRSIATPAIGQGSYGPSEGFGHGLHDAVSAYSSQRKQFPCVKWIHFVDRNEKSVSTVLKTFTRDFEYLRISQAVIYASEGDCTSVKADAVVLFQDSTLSINSSLAQKVTGLCDDLYSQKLETFKEQGPCIGSVYRIIASGDRPDVCKDVLLAVAIGDRLSETRNEKASSDEFKKLVNAVLVKCERWNVAKLCIPLFEIEGFNIAELTSVVAELVFEYFRTSEKSEVKEVYFLGEQQFVIRLVETLQKQFQKVEKWRTEKKLCTHHTELETMV